MFVKFKIIIKINIYTVVHSGLLSAESGVLPLILVGWVINP